MKCYRCFYLILSVLFSIILVSCKNNDSEQNEEIVETIQTSECISEYTTVEIITEIIITDTTYFATSSDIQTENYYTQEIYYENIQEEKNVPETVLTTVTEKIQNNITGYFYIKEEKFSIGNNISEILSVLGEPEFCETSKGYHNGSDAIIYGFKNYTLYACENDGKELLYDIEVLDKDFITEEGIYSGMSVKDAKNICGEGSKKGDIIFYLTDNGGYMYLFISGEYVESIGYSE